MLITVYKDGYFSTYPFPKIHRSSSSPIDTDLLQAYNINYLPTVHRDRVIQGYKNWDINRTISIFFSTSFWYKAILHKKDGSVYKYDVPYLRIGDKLLFSTHLNYAYQQGSLFRITKNLSLLKIEKLLHQNEISFLKQIYTIAKVGDGLGVMVHLRGDYVTNIYRHNIKIDDNANPIFESFNVQIPLEDGDVLYVGNVNRFADRIPFTGYYSIDYGEFSSDYATVKLKVGSPYYYSDYDYRLGWNSDIYISSTNPEIWKINNAEYYVPLNVEISNAFTRNRDDTYYVLTEKNIPLQVIETKIIRTSIKQKTGFKIKASIKQTMPINASITSKTQSEVKAGLLQIPVVSGKIFKISYIEIEWYSWVYNFVILIDNEKFYGSLWDLYYRNNFETIYLGNSNKNIEATVLKVPSYEVEWYDSQGGYWGRTAVDALLIVNTNPHTKINIDIYPTIACNINSQIMFKGYITVQINIDCNIKANIIQKFRIQTNIRQELYPFTVEIQKVGFIIDYYWTSSLYFEGYPADEAKLIGNNLYLNLYDLINPRRIESIYKPLSDYIKRGVYYETVYVYKGDENSQSYLTAKSLFETGDERFKTLRNEYRYLPLSLHTRIEIEVSDENPE